VLKYRAIGGIRQSLAPKHVSVEIISGI